MNDIIIQSSFRLTAIKLKYVLVNYKYFPGNLLIHVSRVWTDVHTVMEHAGDEPMCTPQCWNMQEMNHCGFFPKTLQCWRRDYIGKANPVLQTSAMYLQTASSQFVITLCIYMGAMFCIVLMLYGDQTKSW